MPVSDPAAAGADGADGADGAAAGAAAGADGADGAADGAAGVAESDGADAADAADGADGAGGADAAADGADAADAADAAAAAAAADADCSAAGGPNFESVVFAADRVFRLAHKRAREAHNRTVARIKKPATMPFPLHDAELTFSRALDAAVEAAVESTDQQYRPEFSLDSDPEVVYNWFKSVFDQAREFHREEGRRLAGQEPRIAVELAAPALELVTRLNTLLSQPTHF
jgi:hypothetical protein